MGRNLAFSSPDWGIASSDRARGRDESAGMTSAELARAHGVSLRTVRFYQSKGLLRSARGGKAPMFDHDDDRRLALILQGKRLGFTLIEIRNMLAAWRPERSDRLPISRRQCVEQIRLLERQRREADQALDELRAIYSSMFHLADPCEPCEPR